MRKFLIFIFLLCSALTLSSCGRYSVAEYPDDMDEIITKACALPFNNLEVIPQTLDSETIATLLKVKNITEESKYPQFVIRLKAPELDFGQSCTFFQRTFHDGISHMECVVGSDHMLDLILFVNGMVPGEPIDMLVCQNSSDKFAALHYVPKPIECCGESGRRLSIELCSGDMQLFKVKCEGLEPFEKIRAISTSGKEIIVNNIETNEKGVHMYLVMPGVIDREFGTANMTIISETGKYSPLTLDYDWGLGSLKKNHKVHLDPIIAQGVVND